jgi:hypothetical protein
MNSSIKKNEVPPNLETDDARLVKELEQKISKEKDIPLRKKMVQLLRQFTFFIQNNDDCSIKEKEEYFKYVQEVEKYTQRADELLEGGKTFNVEEIQRVKDIFGVDISNMQNIPIPGYWRDVMKNAKVRWGPLDDNLLDTLSRVDVHTKLNPDTRTTEFVEVKFVFNPERRQERGFEDDNLWVRIIFKSDELQKVENSKINWKEGKNPLNEDSKAGGVQVKNSLLDLFTTKDFSIEDELEEDTENGDEQIGQIDREDMERMVDELVNVVSFSLEYYLGVQPLDEDDDDFDDTEY